MVVLAQPPLLEGNAPGKCAVALLRGLIAHGLDVRAIAAKQYFASPGDPPADLPVEVVDVPRPERGVRFQVARVRRPRGGLAGTFAERVRELAPYADVIHLEETETAWCDEGSSRPSLVHLHFRVRRDRALGRPWRNEFRYVLEHAAAERLAIARHRYLVASSPVVADSIRAVAPRAEVVVSPLALEPDHYGPAPLDGPPVAGIIGTAGWAPTADALTRLLERVWPGVRASVPDARLRVAGRGTGRMVADTDAGVEVLGEVGSAPAFLRDLSLLLYPVTRGSGVKVKVLEALASGLPVVTTPLGAEGIEPCAGVIVAESDADIVAAAARVLEDPQERAERGAAARRTFLERYSPIPATEPLVALYHRMAEDARGGGGYPRSTSLRQ